MSTREFVIEMVNNPDDLHRIILNYNWDDGFEIPNAVLDNENCELSTALTIFELAEGVEYLTEKEQIAYDEYDKEFASLWLAMCGDKVFWILCNGKIVS